MKLKTPVLGYDERTMREVVQDAGEMKMFISSLENQLAQAGEPSRQVSLLGEIGFYLRTLGDLEQSGKKLELALVLIATHRLGSKREAQQKIRLAHVFQWKKDFAKSNRLFEEVISFCRGDEGASHYLDFALQHAGKNYFDQHRFHEALTHFHEALEIRMDKNSPADQITSTENAIAEVKRRLAAT